MKFALFFLSALSLISCSGSNTQNKRVIASISQDKTFIKKIHSEKQQINIPDEIKFFMNQLVTKNPYQNQFEQKIKSYKEKENFHQSEWDSILWFVEFSDTLDLKNGYHSSSSIYLVRQSIGEGFHHGLNQTYNVVAKVKVELSYNYEDVGVTEIKNGDAVITFLGFINQVPLKLSKRE